MFRSIATRSASFARNLVVPNQVKCTGKYSSKINLIFLLSYWFIIM